MPVHDWSRVDANVFHHFHQRWTVSICDALNAGRLPPGFSALLPPTPRDPQGIHKAIWDEIEEEPFELPPGKPLSLATYSRGAKLPPTSS